MKILICGLPGSGKTTLAKCLSAKLNADWFNADEVRATYDDWDFSESGRIRQAKRMSTLADKSKADHTLCDDWHQPRFPFIERRRRSHHEMGAVSTAPEKN